MSGAWVVVTGDVTTVGGQDKANEALARFLVGRGDVVHIVSHRLEGPLARDALVRWTRVPRPLGSHLLGERLLDHAGRRVARRVLAQDARARVVVNGGNCAWADVVWMHLVHAAWTARDDGAPLRVRLKNRALAAQARAAERRNVRAARLVLANSERTRKDVLGLVGGVDPARVSVVYLGADATRFGPIDPAERAAKRRALGCGERDEVVVFVGALGWDRRKGLDTLLDAWTRLPRDGDRPRRLLAAGGGALGAWRADVARRGLAATVTLLGEVEDVPGLLAAADLLVSPTRYEPYGLNVHEALCRGLPALVTRAAGVAEVYPAALQSLVLPDPDDAATLAARIVRALAERDALRPDLARLGATLRERTWEAVARDLVSAIEAAPRVGEGLLTARA